jgi:hypothetical protein
MPKMRRGKRLSPFRFMGVGVTLLIVLGAGLYFVALPRLFSHAAGTQAQAQPNMDCTLIVPQNPLSAQGLATPYQLVATNANNGPCNETNANQSAFVQGVIYDPVAGKFSIYNPLVIDKGTQPALKPVVPTLPQKAVVGIWFGFNGNALHLKSAGNNALTNGRCVNGLGQSDFGQFAYCNAPAFFAAANQGVVSNKVVIPPLQTAKDGKTCPTLRDFSVVDQDQSDNVQTQYLSIGNGQTAQFSAANQAQLKNSMLIANPSDNALLTNFIDPALGCQSWMVPDLANNNTPAPALALDELQASMDQKAPLALVPLTDPMTMIANGNNTQQSLVKTELYRLGVDQIPPANADQASGVTYCQNLLNTGMPRLALDKQFTINATTPDAAMANSLFTFLAQRFQASYNNLNCPNLLNIPNPVTTQLNNQGVAISATFNGNMMGQNPPPTTSAPNCNINGTYIAGCTGTVTINGQSCMLFVMNNIVEMHCANKTK